MSGASKPCGIYVHIPFCKSKCKYCAFVSVTDFSLQHAYVDALIGEITSAPERGCDIDTVYIGGGTPSCLYSGAIERVVNTIKSSFNVAPTSEITVECNPESVTQSFVNELVRAGANRVSMGLQSADDGILKAIGRVHDFAAYSQAIKLISEKIEKRSSDLIVGLPNQTAADVVNSINAMSEYCSHISVYALTKEENAPLFNNFTPDDDFTAELYDIAYERLSTLGFNRYEVSNFARSGQESRHNKKYWGCLPYIGFGAAAHGYDGEYTRYSHTCDVREYIANPIRNEYTLTDMDRYNEYVMLRLRTAAGIDCKAFKTRFGYEFDGDNATLATLIKDGYIIHGAGRYYIPPKYAFVMNGIIEQLMLD